MNDLGTLLTWSALQTTVLALVAAALYPFAARRPALGAAVAAAGLIGCVAITFLAFCPLPSWDLRAPATVQAQAQAPQVDPPSADASDAAAAPGASWSVDLARLARAGASRAAAPFADRSQSGWAMAAIVFIGGTAFGLLRLGGGLWAVFDLRRHSRPILDVAALDLLRQLRAQLGCRAVELRECPGIGAPAAAGWPRPVVLLPADWRDWDNVELRAALAHELAHVRRSDFLIGLIARLGLALHFYHPLLYWLAGRLRLQQELAADGLAARAAGGRDVYLLGLARLALRLNDRRPAGWLVSPLFSCGTLMRRIQMLKTRDGQGAGRAWRFGRLLFVFLLAAVVIGVAALRCPAQKAAAPLYAVEFVDGGTVGEKDAAPEPFDLSYMPPDAMGVVCFRPSAVLGRPAMKEYADKANKALAQVCTGFGMPRAFGLSVADIAQVTMALSIKTNPKTKTGQTAVMFGTPMMIRATKDFDWSAEIVALLPDVKEVKHGDRIVYELPTDGPLASISLGMKMCCYVPDRRTILFDTEERLAGQKEHPAPAWAADFKRVDRGIGALVIDNRDGAWGRELAGRDKPEPQIAPFQDHTSWVVAGFSADDGFVCDVSARFDGEEMSEKATKAINGGLAAARDVLATPESFWTALGDDPKAPDGPAKNRGRKAQTFFKSLVQEPELKREGASVRLRCRAKGDVTEILSAILEGEIGL